MVLRYRINVWSDLLVRQALGVPAPLLAGPSGRVQMKANTASKTAAWMRMISFATCSTMEMAKITPIESVPRIFAGLLIAPCRRQFSMSGPKTL